MPRKIEPKWGQSGVICDDDLPVSVIDDTLTAHLIGICRDAWQDSEVRRRRNDPGAVQPKMPEELRSTAASVTWRERLRDIELHYLRWRHRETIDASGPQVRRALQLVAEQAAGLNATLASLDDLSDSRLFDGLCLVLSQEMRAGAQTGNALAERDTALIGIERIHRAAEAALAINVKSRPRPSLAFAVANLVDLYEATSKVAATHTTRADGEYTGTPRTFAGRFVAAFFERVDPEIEPRTIASLLEKIIWGKGSPRRTDRRSPNRG